MKLDHSLVTRRTFLNTLFGGWLAAIASGGLYAFLKFVFPTAGKEPDFVVLNRADFLDIPGNTVKMFAWGGKPGFFLKRDDGTTLAVKGVCTHMECNISYQPDVKKFYCACHKGWFDDNGRNIAGPPPKPLERFDIVITGQKLVIAKKGAKVDLPKA
ncbi:MAG: ubiquinol-cytochrome c reductase iron-sulfur subunit [Syntrophorhabdaceae bacterium]|nr:ubiquinol-cytochrome c reductase iron-sulfur subunit [Syntrophorhabdaceae bacterium]